MLSWQPDVPAAYAVEKSKDRARFFRSAISETRTHERHALRGKFPDMGAPAESVAGNKTQPAQFVAFRVHIVPRQRPGLLDRLIAASIGPQ